MKAWSLGAVLLVVVAACGGADDLVYTDDRVDVYDAAAQPSPTTTIAVPTDDVIIERIWSPEPTIAEVLGFGAIAGDSITVDGAAADVVAFDIAADGTFVLRVRIMQEGAYTVCIRDECGRVFVEPEP